VISKTAVFHKSAKGSEALATRSPALTPKLRSTLILVDGKRRFEELAKLAQVLGDAEQMIAALVDLGFVEQTSGGESAPDVVVGDPSQPISGAAPVSGGAAGSAPAVRPAVPLADAKRYAVRRLTDLLGPTAESLCLRLEGARNATEFMAAIQRAESVLRDFSGAKVAAQFAADIEAHRPA
jgi:hypothetical protein